MNLSDIADRGIFRFTGPPENWLTAIKYMTWGLEEKHLPRWQRIEAGDIFLMHSTSTNTLVKGAPSAVIGFGVVSPDFKRKSGPLWLEEIENHENKWPLLVPFSEVYLFSELRPYDVLKAPDGNNNDLVVNESRELLSLAIPLPSAFPKMGSISSVQPAVAVEIFSRAQSFYLYNSIGVTQESYSNPTVFKKAETPNDITIRKPASLEQLQIIKKKTIRKGTISFTKDMQTLERAENAHQETLAVLFELLKEYGYETYFNRHVDLFAVKGNHSILFEVKSLSGSNFRSQARKGIVQLYEYDYFEVRKFIKEKQITGSPDKALIFSEGPKNMNYVNFINNLNISAGFVSDRKLESSGQKTILSNLTS